MNATAQLEGEVFALAQDQRAGQRLLCLYLGSRLGRGLRRFLLPVLLHPTRLELLQLLAQLVELFVIPEDEEAEPEIEASREDYVALPILHLHLGVQLSRRFLLFAEADGIDLSTDRYVDATAQVRYQISRNWDLGLGYRVIDRIIDTGEIQNETNRDHLDISLGYRF